MRAIIVLAFFGAVTGFVPQRTRKVHKLSNNVRLQVSPDGLDALRYAAAGAICASASHTGSVPIDVIKTKIQLEPARFAGKGTLQVAAVLVQEEGPLSLTTGALPTLVGYAIQGSFKYGLFEVLKPPLYNSVVYEDGGKLAVLLLAGICAELVASTALCPLETARIASVRDGGTEKETKGLLEALSLMNLESAFSGLPAILLKMVPYTAAQLSTYELATSSLYATWPTIATEQPLLVLPATAACAAGAAVVSSLLSQPGDTLLSEVNSGRESQGEETSAGLLSLAQSLGPAGLMRGTQARLVQMLAIVVTQLLVYDSVKAFVGLPVTGSIH
mmetsp:Transcript_58159/g.131784  ORF Transcript_58159/g.131784 Transcript_58159/m.131784 type:complete len:331 (-) Transcript_58159:312-1304(-)